ncbi:C6 transcription factor [Purpureocillium lilacinum]|uniref:C6 transcription factor n=1 Tax=Purpureocillium lilacinum TaxID=33203 RepID=A0A179HKU5_PURLI|nr:C6 transcription factor [Purpureocillium lilacinum]OAQ90003.1 C6 transcription factor [Purpureocillium lilacinum]
MGSTNEAELVDAEYEHEDTIGSQNRADGQGSEETPACQSCRKKKSKCSRQQPCSQCVKSGVECTYEDKRLKGGIKTGVVERLNQRIDALESMFLGQGILMQQVMDAGRNRVAPPAFSGRSNSEGEHPTILRMHTDRLKQVLQSAAANSDSDQDTLRDSRAPDAGTKRKRSFDAYVPPKRIHTTSTQDLCSLNPLPKDIDDTLTTYFKLVHPWLPVLHPATFLRRAHDPNRSDGVTMILRAIVAVAAKHVQKSDAEDVSDLSEYAEACRQAVVATAMEGNSIEAVQALLLITFDTLGSGSSSSPWSLVSLVTRKVEDLQLNAEDSSRRDSFGEFFLTSPPVLQPATTWLETEERRRVFWAAFLMDRFCSIMTSAAPVISSKSIRRRLPCDGCMWESDQCVETSYFKLDDQPQVEENTAPEETSPFPPPYATKEGPNGVGGLAYTIEATESLSLITKFNLRHSLEHGDANRLSAWLTRFRQLDSRLLQWELCLTHRWRDVRVVNGYIDPNLTLAHMTHNAAIIMLHRRLAHPPPQSKAWLSGLVSAASKEACVMAAMKIDKISRRYLAVTQASYYAVRPPDEVSSIISSLNEVSRRLSADSQANNMCPESPATKLARALAEQRDRDLPSYQAEASTSRPQQQTPFPDFYNISSAADIPSVLQHCATSPSSGISPGGIASFGADGINALGENVIDFAQSLLPGSRVGGWPLAVSGSGRSAVPDGTEMVVSSGSKDFDFFAELKKLESRAKEYDKRPSRDGEAAQRKGAQES